MIAEHWIDVTNLPAHGREFFFEDQDFWQKVWNDPDLDCQLSGPFVAKIVVSPQDNGFLIRGQIQGKVLAVCRRCAETAQLNVQQNFDTFEALEDIHALEGEEVYLQSTDSGWELNIGALLREEILLALPEKILCADTCLGLCPHCGKNKNQENCACCSKDSQSPLAQALRDLKIKTN